MILSSALMNSRFAADFGLRGREKFFLKIHLTSLKYFFNLLLRAFHINSNFSVEISRFLFRNLQ